MGSPDPDIPLQAVPTMAHAIIHHLIPPDRLSSNLIPFPIPFRFSVASAAEPACQASQVVASRVPTRRRDSLCPIRDRERGTSSDPAPNGDGVPAALAAVHLPLPRQVRPRRAQTPAALRRPLQRRRR